MIEYPASLPAPQIDGYRRRRSTGVLDSDRTEGRLYARQISSDNPTSFNVEWIMTQAEAQEFDTFWRTTLAKGTRPFITGLFNEAGMEPQQCRFTPQGKPRLSSVQADTYFYSATVTVRKVEQKYDGEYQYIRDLSEISPNGDWIKGLALLDIAINIDAPEYTE